MPSQTVSAYASIHGLGIRIRSANPEVLEHFRHDFHYFLKPDGPVELEVMLSDEAIGQARWKMLYRGKKSAIYLSPQEEKRVCFFSKVWLKYRYADGICLVSGNETGPLYEALYFVVLSFVGERLDAQGKHRLHGLALASDTASLVLLARSGGGKSTIAQHLLNHDKIRILSDDTPVLNRLSQFEAFPQRIALSEKPNIPHAYLRQFPRYFSGTKYVIGAEYFRHQIQSHAPWDSIVLLKRDESTDEAIVRRLPKILGVWPLFKWLVVGYEIPQIWELYLRVNFSDLPSKVRTLASRIAAARRLYGKMELYELKSGRDPKAAAVLLAQFLNRRAEAK